jgi:hypothetical protein
VKEEVMNADPEYRRFQFTVADLLAVMVIVAVLGSLSTLPVSLLHAIPLLAVLYVVKYRILTLRVQPWLGLLLYFLVVAALLPYLYCRATVAFNNDFASPLDWIWGPIEVFMVPTASFLYDVLTRKRPSLKFYTARSLLEILIFIPLWDYVWVWIYVLSTFSLKGGQFQ